MSVILETTIGDIVVDLFIKERPRACLNFLKLCKIKYYNFSLFHKVESNFIAQTGDPTGTGRGGESVFSKLYGDQARYFEAETTPRMKHLKVGTLSMVNNGDDMHSSQFFVTLADDLDYLDGKHTVFGEVAEGFEVIEKLNEIICDDDFRPYQDIRISHTIILEDPFDDPKGLPIPDRSPKPTQEQLANARIGADEDVDDAKGKSLDQIEEEIRDKEAKARSTILEMVGDLPSADAKPEDNVLFICKLNPVTTDEDLQIIFSRFGNIVSCEVIKDKKSGESLQYAFIEFAKSNECENAYFKMDNVLIDDRRIHVDFSQSVAHLTWKKDNPFNKPDSDPRNNPKFQLKDKKQNNNYDLLFENDAAEASDKKSGKRSNETRDSNRRPRSKSPRDKYRDKKMSKHVERYPGRDSGENSKKKDNLRSRSSSADERERHSSSKHQRRRSPSGEDKCNYRKKDSKSKHDRDYKRHQSRSYEHERRDRYQSSSNKRR